jgi:hypothetical protein
MTVLDWLTVPQQRLLGVVRGAVYADPAGELAAVREALRWYPDDVWRWLLAAQWRRVEQEEAFVGRASEAGDELGSRLVAARLVRELMALVFLLDREYRPYTKWFGTAFTRLPTGAALRPVLERVTAATGLPAREAALAEVYEAVAVRHNAVAGTAEVEPRVRGFHARPYRVLGAGRFVQACLDTVEDPWLRALPLVGSVDQFADSTDVLSAPAVAGRLRAVYTGPVPATP